ncbi:salicylate hydroxylase [Nocardioides albertanoniae]|uniref:Salicylate hydroxylase n=1 Tax=Nocardioides albertanoniae TaxID=1175486 RepID=A0A543AAJ1_9ACTN|nr:FAD-dependent monooxygenase [Nocardioides albertanoniae]TQL69624.1 salicylate hydroxylase [Nocardioides albertanoniae]
MSVSRLARAALRRDRRARRVTIIGAGIGGLTLAIELRRQGIEVEVFEATTDPRERGAAVVLPANATRILSERLHLDPGLGEASARIEGLSWRDGHTGVSIGRALSAEAYAARCGASAYGIHHGDLHTLLAETFGDDGLHLGQRLVKVTDAGGPAVLEFSGGGSTEADLVIGADGGRSMLREAVVGYDDAQFSGCVAWHGIVPRSQATLLPHPSRMQVWMGADGHLMHHPVGADDLAFLLVRRHPGPWTPDAWVQPADHDEHVHAYAGWHPAVVQLISEAPCSDRLALFHRPPLSTWTHGRITLLGDAAHLAVPHHGQGAAQAIEDAIVLADCLAADDDWRRARRAYEVRRRDRARRVQIASLAAADVFHLPDGPRAEARNKRLKSLDAYERHLAWIHDLDAIGHPGP